MSFTRQGADDKFGDFSNTLYDGPNAHCPSRREDENGSGPAPLRPARALVRQDLEIGRDRADKIATNETIMYAKCMAGRGKWVF